MSAVKLFQSYDQQVERLMGRGMDVGDREDAAEQLRQINYYRLSGYWYPFRRRTGAGRSDEFEGGTNLGEVLALYRFDVSLRATVFASLAPIELTIRAHLGHALGREGECIHLEPGRLNARARSGGQYGRWLDRYDRELADSREDFVLHHRERYDGVLPVWAAVEVLDWGGLTKLYGFAPRAVQDAVAGDLGLTAPQLESWLKSLNIVRNVCAHHGRLFNRVFALSPKLPAVGRYPELDLPNSYTRSFGQLTLIQFVLDRLGLKRSMLPAVMRTYPTSPRLPISWTGAANGWAESPLWR